MPWLKSISILFRVSIISEADAASQMKLVILESRQLKKRQRMVNCDVFVTP